MLLLNRQSIRPTESYDQTCCRSSAQEDPTHHTQNHHEPSATHSPRRGRRLVTDSAACILRAFLFLRVRDPGMLMYWNISQHTFNASMILLFDGLETGNLINASLVEQVFVVFQELAQNGVHRLAGLAVQYISGGLVKLQQRHMWVAQQDHVSEHLRRGLHPDISSMTCWANCAVMGNTGMFLLECWDPNTAMPSFPSFIRATGACDG